METVCVLLSTYNGEQYLEEQLTSLIQQEGVDVTILVRDDGSSDKTQDILNKWQDDGKLSWYSGNNIGYGRSFLDLLYNAPRVDYYAFCDQDDIWLPNKLYEAIDIIKNYSEKILYFSNAMCYLNGKTVGYLYDKAPSYNKYSCLVQSLALGCTMVLNRKLFDMLNTYKAKTVYSHDFWVYRVAMLFGKTIYDHNAYILHRQHEKNVSGIGNQISLKDRVTRILQNKYPHSREIIAQELLSQFKDVATPETLSIIENVALYRSNIKCKLNLLFSNKYVMRTFWSTVFLKIRIIFNQL